MDKSTLNAIRALRRKSERVAQNRFVVEGEKGISELVESGLDIERMYYVTAMEHAVPASLHTRSEQISVKDMGRISQMSTPPGLLALATTPHHTLESVVSAVDHSPAQHGLIACQLQDPGNLGTLIRSADWFGFGGVLLTEGTVDPWNIKTVQASMGSIFRIPVAHASEAELSELEGHHHLEMQGTSYTDIDWRKGWVWVGSESHGFGQSQLPPSSVPVHIPRIGRAESLNAGIAASIVCAEIARSKDLA
jgi:TrmH family RNA methyltransferase